MKHAEQLTVIVPDQKGIKSLSGIPGVTAILVEPGEPVPASALSADVLVVGPAEQQHEVDDALRQISQLSGLKLLHTLGQGVDQWEGLLPDDLTVSTSRGAHGGSTAEWVVATLLAQVRELSRYLKNQSLHVWEGRQSRTLLNMHLMVYGVGDLGQNIKSRLMPFGVRLTMVGSHNRDGVIDTSTARTLLPTADGVIMALPLTPATRQFVNAEFLAALPDGAIVINAGRGGLVDQPALIDELCSGRLEAALDVVTPEPLPGDSSLWDAPGLLLTPHIGGNTVGADDRAWQIAVKQILAFKNGELSS